jgi:HK97 family phage major capsid protein
MKSAKALGEEIQALQAKVQAIQAVATQENRELLEDEQTEIDSILGTEGKPGQIENLSKQRERAMKIEQAVSNTVRQVVDNQPSAGGNFKIPAKAKAVRQLKAFKGPDAERDAYASGQFINAVLGSDKSKQWCRDHGVLNAMGENNDLNGGALVPVQFENSVISLLEEYGVFARYARNYPMTSDSATLPRRVGGLTAYAVGENAEITSSDASVNQVNLTARKFATLTKVSSELSEDAAIALADMLATEIAYAHAVKQDSCGFLGDGLPTYGNIVGLANVLAAGSVATATGGQNTAAGLTIAVFQDAVSKLPQYPGIRPVWFCHSAVYWNVLARLQFAAGGNTVMDLAGAPAQQFMGYPVVFSQTLPSSISGSTKFAYFGDLGLACTMGMRRSLTIKSDASRYVDFDQIGVFSNIRYDINIHEIGTASVAGPIVQLKAAA